MSLLSDWTDAENDLKGELSSALTQKRPVPKELVALLKTDDLKKALKQADDAQAKTDLEGARKALAGTQKFFLMFGNVLKAAHKALPPNDDELLQAVLMFSAAIPRTQTAVANLNRDLTQASQAGAKNEAEERAAKIKAILTPMKFQYDWKAGKQDFEKATKSKKPSAPILLAFRKSTGIENALAALDKACEACKPDDYRKAYPKFVHAKDEYVKVLNTALTGAKATADPIYKTKCEGLRDLLGSIDTRAYAIQRSLDALDA
jgi:hypothetical protein